MDMVKSRPKNKERDRCGNIKQFHYIISGHRWVGSIVSIKTKLRKYTKHEFNLGIVTELLKINTNYYEQL